MVLVAKKREMIFGAVMDGKAILNDEGTIVQKTIKEIPSHFDRVRVDEYVVMPNHVHILLAVEADAENHENPDLRKIIAGLKSVISRECGRTVWQRSFYDHIIRNEKDYADTVRYIQGNPAEWEKDELR